MVDAFGKGSGFAESAGGPAESPFPQKGAVHVRLKQAYWLQLLLWPTGNGAMWCGIFICSSGVSDSRFILMHAAAFREAPHVPAHSPWKKEGAWCRGDRSKGPGALRLRS